MLPSGSQTAIIEASGTITITAVPSSQAPFYVLGAEIAQANLQSNTFLVCQGATSSQTLLSNFAKSTIYVPMNVPCSGSLVVQKSGNDQSETIVNWIQGTSTQQVAPLPANTIGGFYYGDVLIIAFSFLTFSLLLWIAMWISLKRIKVRVS